MYDLPGLKPSFSLIPCCSIIGAILFSITLWNHRVLSKLLSGHNLGLSPNDWDFMFHDAFVQHCQQPSVGFGTEILQLFHQNIIPASGFVVL